MQYHAISCNTMQYHAIPCYTIQYNAIPCNTMHYPALPCNTMQYHAMPCNTRTRPETRTFWSNPTQTWPEEVKKPYSSWPASWCSGNVFVWPFPIAARRKSKRSNSWRHISVLWRHILWVSFCICHCIVWNHHHPQCAVRVCVFPTMLQRARCCAVGILPVVHHWIIAKLEDCKSPHSCRPSNVCDSARLRVVYRPFLASFGQEDSSEAELSSSLTLFHVDGRSSDKINKKH